MTIEEILTQAGDTMTVKRVFGEPYERDGTMVIPVAAIAGGGGGGSGEPGSENAGSGGGFGMNARPAGVYVVQGDDVRWVPAFDLNRVILGGQIVAVVFLLTLRSIIKARAHAREHIAASET